MKKTVMVEMILFLAAMVAAPVSAQGVRMSGGRSGRVIEGPGYVISTTGGPSVVMSRGNYGYNGGYDNRGGYGYDYDYDYGRGGNRDRTQVSVGLGGRIAGIRVNLGLNKTTYAKPKPRSKLQKVIAQTAPVSVVDDQPVNTTSALKPTSPVEPPQQIIAEKHRLTLVREVGDDKIETICDIIVINPEKDLITGKRIVFNRSGDFFAEYEVIRISGDTVFVDAIDAPRGNPQRGDGFNIEDPAPTNVVD